VTSFLNKNMMPVVQYSKHTLRMSIKSGCSRTSGRILSSGLWNGSATYHKSSINHWRQTLFVSFNNSKI